ncbi:ABC transporter ATP-binding protein [Ascidiimonas sp. W6]|uniref:ABC transporter ATP-binding protein n=1 Tax=Ascidiimonas meishanensis TaxID=3128903 RepID=UPI0030ECDE15
MIILKAENISKQYRLGVVGTGTLSHDINRWWHQIRGKEDPYLKIGEANNREETGSSDYVWALRDINFEVKQGEVLGIIGKNGAGKSTLLKILSKVTNPTTGVIKSKGRIASLLEVGTGFHPELTGRENVFLNGAILGMTKAEINSKLDEIISFSGCERYIDTPVKRYSSGMKVRLAFAVAAHLEPEILVVDEVLAVGDAEFQKKAIGKMQDISRGDGRTVLFVSHNMAAVQSLCTRAIVLEQGNVVFTGKTSDAISDYLSTKGETSSCINDMNDDFINSISIGNGKIQTNYFEVGDQFELKIGLKKRLFKKIYQKLGIGFYISKQGNAIAGDTTYFCKDFQLNSDEINYKIKNLFLTPGNYSVSISVADKGVARLTYLEDVLTFSISSKDINATGEKVTEALGNVYLNGLWRG